MTFDHVAEIRAATGTTVNDVCLAAVAGALRETALSRGETPRALKAMVPVNVRADDERHDLGNRISMAFVDLPVGLSSPAARLEAVRRAGAEFKQSGKPEGTGTVFGALGMLPTPLRTGAAKMVGSKRVYNLTVSNIPGPRSRCTCWARGCARPTRWCRWPRTTRCRSGIFGYHDHLHFGLYADPEALPDVAAMPGGAERRDAGAAAHRRPRRRPHPLRGRAAAQHVLGPALGRALGQLVALSAAQAARSIAASGSVASTTSSSPAGTVSMAVLAMTSGIGHFRPRASVMRIRPCP